jgi:hypothetical protein
MGRYEKRKLAQFKNNLKTSFVHDVQIKKKGVRSPRVLHNLNFEKRICKLRREDKENL